MADQIDFTPEEQINFQPEQPAKTSVAADIGKAIGRTLVGIPKGIVETFLPPESDYEKLKRSFKGLSDIVHGKSLTEVAQNVPEAGIIPSFLNPNVSREQKIETGLGLGVQIGSLALPFLKGAKVRLGETIFGKRAAPVEEAAAPPEPVPVEAEKAAEEVIPSAIEERQQPESNIPEYPRNAPVGTTAETSGGGGIEPSAPEQAQEVAAPIEEAPAAEKPMAAEQAAGFAEVPADGGYSTHPLIQFIRDEVGGILSRSGAAKKLGKAAYERNKSLWDSAPEFPDPRHNKIYNSKTGVTPDEAADAAVREGLLPEGADASTLFQEIQDISDNSHRLAKTGREARSTIKSLEKQYRSFTAAAVKQQRGEAPVNASELNVGDTVTVSGEPMKVTGIDPDTFDVTLEDGSKFGIQHVAGDQVIYGEHEPVSAKAAEPTVEQAPEPAPPAPPEETRPLEQAPPPSAAPEKPVTTGGVSAEAMEGRPIEPPPPGTGVGWEESRDFGNKWLDSGGDINKVVADFQRTGKLDQWDVGKGAAYLERLQAVTDKARDALRADPNDGALQLRYEDALAKEQRFSNDFKPMATAASNQLKGFQGRVPLTEEMADSFSSLTRKFGEINGREVTPQQVLKADRLAKQNAKAKADYNGANGELYKRAETEYGRIRTARKGPPTLEDIGKIFGRGLKEVCEIQ